MENNSCFWQGVFDDGDRYVLQEGMIVTGIFSFTLSLWVTLSILITDLRNNWSCKNLANFYLISCLRRFIPTFWNNLPMFGVIENFIDDKTNCDIEGFLDTFFSVFEVELLTHVCIERYVVAKYANKGWDVMRSHYSLYFSLSVLFSFLYSVPPLFGFGRYGYDFTCTTCIFDMILPELLDNIVIIIIFLLRCVKPVILMILMLKWASTLEHKCYDSDKMDLQFTNSIYAVVSIYFACWTPKLCIKSLIIIVHLLNMDPLIYVSVNSISWAIWMHWVAPGMSVIALLATDERVCTSFTRVFARSAMDEVDNGKKQE